ncbi:hypothetical protein GPROT2_01739 [Gammaproteobacteria bacterium]|nr:DUF4426 domain-containing protein [Gammaproteobacteria bacterium]CAG0942474.1 hypothetical protein GPROT2_01739 [Gammaproteobacteria bacterium]
MSTSIRTVCMTLAVLGLMSGCGGPGPGSAPPAGSPPTAAEPAGAASKDFGDYVVHFSALSTDQLTPEVARTYGITRSRNRALLNVSVLKKAEGTLGKPVTARVTALVANDTGQVKDSTVREIREGEAVYYIADYAVSNGETLVFNVEVVPEGATAALPLRFTQTFYGE